MASHGDTIATANRFEVLDAKAAPKPQKALKFAKGTKKGSGKQDKKANGHAVANGNGAAPKEPKAAAPAQQQQQQQQQAQQAPAQTQPQQNGSGGGSKRKKKGKGGQDEAVAMPMTHGEVLAIDTFVEQLNTLAKRTTWSQRRRIVNEWVRQLQDSKVKPVALDADGSQIGFRQAFARSKALYHTVESFLRSPGDSEDDMLRLFALCLAGDQEYHTKVVDGLVNLSTRLRLHDYPEIFVSAICETVCALQANSLDNSRLARNISQLEDKIQQRETLIEGVHGSDPTKVLADKTKHSQQLVQDGLQKYVAAMQYQDTLPNPDKAKEVAERVGKSLGEFVAAVDDSKNFTAKKRKEIGEMKDTAAKNRDSELVEVSRGQEQLTKDEERLLARKLEIETELKKISEKLNDIKFNRVVFEKRATEADDTFKLVMETLQDQDARLDVDVAKRQNEMKVLPDVKSFISSCETAMSGITKGSSDTSRTIMNKASAAYLDGLVAHLTHQRDRMQLLGRRLTFYQSKVQSLQKERKEIAELGMLEVAGDLNRGLEKMEMMHAETVATVSDVEDDVAKCSASLKSLHIANNSTTQSRVHQINALLKEISKAKPDITL